MTTDETTPVYPGMPAQVSPLQASAYHNEGIASMRWESDPLVINLRIRLGSYVPTHNTTEGKTQLVRPEGVDPMVNDVGIDRFIALIQGVVNPVTSLSNIDDQEANTLIRQILHDMIFEIAYNKDRFKIHSGDMRNVFSILKSLVFMQVKRAVAGHESENFRTQTFEQSLNQSIENQNQRQGWNPFQWGGRKKA